MLVEKDSRSHRPFPPPVPRLDHNISECCRERRRHLLTDLGPKLRQSHRILASGEPSQVQIQLGIASLPCERKIYVSLADNKATFGSIPFATEAPLAAGVAARTACAGRPVMPGVGGMIPVVGNACIDEKSNMPGWFA